MDVRKLYIRRKVFRTVDRSVGGGRERDGTGSPGQHGQREWLAGGYVGVDYIHTHFSVDKSKRVLCGPTTKANEEPTRGYGHPTSMH